jgi:hypothetical protein
MDANSPLRAYRREVLVVLLQRVEPEATVPHLQFSVLERRSGLVVRELPVTHRVRRGTSAVGTTWQGRGRRLPLPSRRLLAFSWHAACELLGCVRDPAPDSEVKPVLPAAA